MSDHRTTRYNERGDVWQHSHAFHHQTLPQAERSRDIVDVADRCLFRAERLESGDRTTAQLFREAHARIRALETLVVALQAAKRCAIPEGGA